MFTQTPLLALAFGLVSSASAAPQLLSLSKRWDSGICADNPGVPIPDSSNFKLPLETIPGGDGSGRQDMCWDMCIGDIASCTSKTKVCYNFSGYNLVFDYQAIQDYTYTSASVWVGVAAPSNPTPQYTTDNGGCTIAADGSTVHCEVPYSAITGKTTPANILAAMCPLGDREAGFNLYLYTNAVLTCSTGVSVPAEGRLSCSDWPTCTTYYPFTYWELTWRCSKCPDTPPPPPPPPVVKTCAFGTAFGYSEKNPTSLTLDSYSPLPNTCKRWGWYETPSAADLTGEIGGPLYVGAGGNVISKAANVGTWSAHVTSGLLYVEYGLSARYSLAQVHVDVGCLPYPTCAPGKYAYVNEAMDANGAVVSSFYTPGLKIPTCSASSKLYIIVHAAVNSIYTIPADIAPTWTCPAVVAT